MLLKSNINNSNPHQAFNTDTLIIQYYFTSESQKVISADMKFITTATATLLSATALAAPIIIGRNNSDTVEINNSGTPSATYKIEDFTTRKYDGQHISTVSFKIVAFNAETLAECSSDNFVMDQRYTCSNDRFSFTYVDYYDWVKPSILSIREETGEQ